MAVQREKEIFAQKSRKTRDSAHFASIPNLEQQLKEMRNRKTF